MRTMASNLEALILIVAASHVAASHLAANRPVHAEGPGLMSTEKDHLQTSDMKSCGY